MFKTVVQGLAMLASVVLLGACAGPGERKEIQVLVPQLEAGKPADEVILVVHDRQVPKYWLDRDRVALNYLVKGKVSEGQKNAVDAVEKGCREYAKLANSHPAVTIGSHALLFGSLGAIGGAWASNAFPRTHAGEYAEYVGKLGTTSGAGSGIVYGGGERVYSFENCGEEVLRKAPRGVTVLH